MNDRHVLSLSLMIVRHPVHYLVRQWNWKSALLSALIRGSIFFFTNLTAGWRAAGSALLLEFCYRALMSGVMGSITQVYRRAEPAWVAGLWTMLLLPLTGHLIEFLAHFLHGTPHIVAGVGVSLIFTCVSTLFNLHAMRNGVLLVGGEARSFWRDMADMPGVVVSFVAAGPMAAWRLLRRQ